MTGEAQAYFAPPAKGVALWGSSSMADGQPEQSTPLPVRFADRLSLLFPRVLQAAVGGTRSGHCLLQRGLRDARVRVLGAPAPGAAAEVEVTGFVPCLGFHLPGELEGTPGVLTASWEAWTFTADDPAAEVRSGRFVSTLPRELAGMRHLLWTGKNNITDVQTVLSDVQELWDLAPKDTLVLGHWCTDHDAVGSETAAAVEAVNAAQAEAYGERFLDLGRLLRQEETLSRPVVAGLRLLEQASTVESLERGVTPSLLVADDIIHLNGWGNLLVLDLLVERLRALGWTR